MMANKNLSVLPNLGLVHKVHLSWSRELLEIDGRRSDCAFEPRST